MGCHVIILAAGRGTRMRSDIPKVLHPIGGQPMLLRLMDTVSTLKPEGIFVVCHAQAHAIKSALSAFPVPVHCVDQEPLLGTGHAVVTALRHIPPDSHQPILVLMGDVPLLQAQTLQRVLDATPKAGLGLLVTHRPDPSGFGRVVTEEHSGKITAVIEEADATADQKKIQTVWTGVLCASAQNLHRWLSQCDNNNTQKEYYLPGILPYAVADQAPIMGIEAQDWQTTQGINTPEQWHAAERWFQQHQAHLLMHRGVTIADASRFDLRGELHAQPGVFIDINVVIEGVCSLGEGVTIGPHVHLRHVHIGAHTHIKGFCVIEEAEIESGCVVGPFAHLRSGTHLLSASKIGNFVETKNTTLGPSSKANHLSYLGDAVIGSGVNLGAGTITCNYDGRDKHTTVVGDGAFIGSGTQLVAPVTIGEQAVIGAGSVITRSAPEHQLTLSRAPQRSLPYKKR